MKWKVLSLSAQQSNHQMCLKVTKCLLVMIIYLPSCGNQGAQLDDLGLELGRVWQHIKRILKKKEFGYFIDTLTGDMYWALFYMHVILKTMRQVKLQNPKCNGLHTLVWWPPRQWDRNTVRPQYQQVQCLECCGWNWRTKQRQHGRNPCMPFKATE